MPTKCNPARLERLTDAQVARFPEFVKRWIDIGLSAAPADRAAAERGVRLAYECAGLEPPKQIVWCSSPLSQGLTRAIVFGLANGEVKIGEAVEKKVWASVRDSVRASVRASVGDSVRASVRASVGASVWASVGASVGASVRDSVGASVWASVWASVGDSVWASVWASVRDSVGASVGDSVWASVRDSVRASVRDSVQASVGASVGDSGYGQHDAGWLAFYDYFREAAGLDEQTKKLAGIWLISQSAGWWLPHKNLCWVSERHNTLHRDDAGRLHCESGPALAYPDGWGIFAIGGVRVDEQIVMRPETQTLEQIDAEQNAEIRRVRIERFGWMPYLKKTGARVLDYRKNDVEATKEALMETGKGERILVCHCPSTGRIYAMQIAPEVATCEAAQNFLWSGNRYAEGQRRKTINIIGRT